MTADRTVELRALAQRVADALPAELVAEVVLTGSVSRGMADDVSDIEMLVVTREPLDLGGCFRLARTAGLDEVDTWGEQGGPTKRVSGHRDGVPLELIWWSSEDAEAHVDELLGGAMHSTADALVHGVALRTGGRLSVWQERLRSYPPELGRVSWISSRLRGAQARASRRCRRRRSNPGIGDSSALRCTHLAAARSP